MENPYENPPFTDSYSYSWSSLLNLLKYPFTGDVQLPCLITWGYMPTAQQWSAGASEVSLGHATGKSARGTEILPDSLSVHTAPRVAYVSTGVNYSFTLFTLNGLKSPIVSSFQMLKFFATRGRCHFWKFTSVFAHWQRHFCELPTIMSVCYRLEPYDPTEN